MGTWPDFALVEVRVWSAQDLLNLTIIVLISGKIFKSSCAQFRTEVLRLSHSYDDENLFYCLCKNKYANLLYLIIKNSWILEGKQNHVLSLNGSESTLNCYFKKIKISHSWEIENINAYVCLLKSFIMLMCFFGDNLVAVRKAACKTALQL